jgi:hypothetical protein
MNLLDRYLLAVKKYLPWKRQDDILAELKGNLESQLEEKEADLGRTLTSDEMQDWVKHLGPPMVMAGRYQPQQYLIGPTIFPMYWWVMRLALLWCLVIYSVIKAVEIIANSPTGSAVLNGVLGAPWVLLITAAWVTAVFAAIEFATTHSLAKFPADIVGHVDWSPGSLPTAEEAGSGGKRPRSFAHAVTEVVFGFLALIWLLLIPSYPFLLMGPGAAYLRMSPYQLATVWVPFFWCIVALNVVQLGWRLIDLVRGTRQNSRALQHLTVKTIGLAATLILFTAPHREWVLLKHPAIDAARYGAAVNSINHGIYTALLWVVAISVMVWLWQIGQMGVDYYRKRVAAEK